MKKKLSNKAVQLRYQEQVGYANSFSDFSNVYIYTEARTNNPYFLFFFFYADKKFSFLNADELEKMKEEEGKIYFQS